MEPGERSLDASCDHSRRLSPMRGRDWHDNEHGQEQTRELGWGARQGQWCAGDKAPYKVIATRVYAPRECSRIIGPGGFNINAIRRHSGCDFEIFDRLSGGKAKEQKQTAKFSGTRVQVDLAMLMVDELLTQDDGTFATEAFFERMQQGSKTTVATVAQHRGAETREQSIGSAASVQGMIKLYTFNEVGVMVGIRGDTARVLQHYSGCTFRQGPKPRKGCTALVKVRFNGTPAQVELAVEMIRELHAAFRDTPKSDQQTLLRDFEEQWKREADVRAAGVPVIGVAPGVVSKEFNAPSVGPVIGNARQKIARNAPTPEAILVSASHGDGDRRMLVKYPVRTIGLIIGSKGTTMHSISGASGCHISIEGRPPPEVKVQTVTFSGKQAQIDLAVGMVQTLMSQGSLDFYSYASKHAVQRQEPGSSGSLPCDGGREEIAGTFPELGSTACKEEQAAGYPSRQSSTRHAPPSLLESGSSKAADGGCSKRARVEHTGARAVQSVLNSAGSAGVGCGDFRGGGGGSSDINNGELRSYCAFIAPPPILVELLPMRGRPSKSTPAASR